MRRLLYGVGLFLATVPMDFACSTDEPDDDGGLTSTDTDTDDIEIPGDGDGMGGDSNQSAACASFSGLDNCQQQGETAKKRDVQLLLVIDKSGSMDDSGGFPDSKWETMRLALEASLSEVKSEVNLGLSLYPYPENELTGISKDGCGMAGNCCEMPTDPEPNIVIGSGTETVPAIIEEFVQVRPGGGTPTAVALEHAYEYFVSGTGKDLPGDKYVILATDGGPNCNSDLACESSGCTLNIEEREACEIDGDMNCCTGEVGKLACLDDEASLSAVSKLFGAGIDTFVVGVPGSEAYEQVLDDLAENGGRPLVGEDQKYFRVEAAGGVDALAGVFRRITQDLVTSCDIQLDEPPTSLTDVNVAVNCVVYPKTAIGTGNGGAGGAEGAGENWSIDTDTNPPTIRLHGAMCDDVKKGVDRVDVILGCPPVF